MAIARGRAANRRIARQQGVLLKRGKVPAPVFVPLFLLALLVLVHCPGLVASALSQTTSPKPGAAAKKDTGPQPPKINYGLEDLPGPVRELREAMLSAVQSGEIEELRHVYETSDIKPDLGALSNGDPVANWKRVSGDGKGQEVLAALSLILEAGYVVLPLGRDLENNRLYIWPYFAEVPLDKLTPAQEVELLRLVPPPMAKNMREKGKYTYWRLAIGADGTWHSFKKAD